MENNPRYALYLTGNDREYLMELSHNSSLDLEFWHSRRGYHLLVVLTPFFSLAKTYSIWQQMTDPLERQGVILPRGCNLEGMVQRKRRRLSRLGFDIEERFFPACERTVGVGELRRIAAYLGGRLLTLSEVRRAIVASGFLPSRDPSDILQLLHLEGLLQRMPAVMTTGKEGVCQRCGERQISWERCAICGETCASCETCREMGKTTGCEPLYAFSPQGLKDYPVRQISPNLPFNLTEPQAHAAARLVQFLNEKTEEALVWAACGAGKTEVSFPATAKVLEKGKRVLYAAPRRDVVIEMDKRFRAAFPQVEIVSVWGGSKNPFRTAQLTLATTHQALRYFRAFDLVILDEVDAFPFEGNRILLRAVHRSRKPGGKLIFLTATPDGELQRRAAVSQLACVTIPARPHGHPLPEPQMLTVKSRQGNIARELIGFIHQSIEGDLCQVMVFVPTVMQAQETAMALRSELTAEPHNLPANWIQYSHSRDFQREKKCRDFIAGQFPVLVCTSILERGINISKINVVVLHADRENIFDTAALVQMAGRAGRDSSYPRGRVWFLAGQVTPAMREAKAQIRMLNTEAYREGYLRAEYYQVDGSPG